MRPDNRATVLPWRWTPSTSSFVSFGPTSNSTKLELELHWHCRGWWLMGSWKPDLARGVCWLEVSLHHTLPASLFFYMYWCWEWTCPRYQFSYHTEVILLLFIHKVSQQQLILWLNTERHGRQHIVPEHSNKSECVFSDVWNDCHILLTNMNCWYVSQFDCNKAVNWLLGERVWCVIETAISSVTDLKVVPMPMKSKAISCLLCYVFICFTFRNESPST